MLRLHHRAVDISIHAPREGSDLHAGGHIYAEGRISIHAPREGSDTGRMGTPSAL